MKEITSLDQMDIKDKKILYTLTLNARFSINTLSKITGLSRDIVKYRLDRLEKEGIIAYYVTHTNIWKMGYQAYVVLLKLRSTDKETNDKLLNYLINNKYITWINKVHGSLDLIIAFTCETKDEIILEINKFLKDFKEIIVKYDILESIREKFTGRKYILPKEDRDEVEKRLSTTNDRGSFYNIITKHAKDNYLKIDEKDKEIMTVLEKRCRISLKELAHKCNLPISTTYNRLKKLTENKYIFNFYPYIAPFKYALIYNWCLLQANITDKHTEAKFTRFMNEHENIEYWFKTLGRWNWLIGLTVKDAGHLQQIIDDFIQVLGKDFVNFEVLNSIIEISINYLPKSEDK